MADSPHGTSDGRAGRKGVRRVPRALQFVLALVGLAVIALVTAALIPGGGQNGNKPFSVASIAGHQNPANQLRHRITKVVGTNESAKKFGTEVAAQEDQGVTPQGQPTGDLSPLPPRAFAIPVARFRTYAEHWAVRFAHDLPALENALVAGSRPAAKRAWAVAWSDYLHLGAVYGLLPGTLDQQMDGLPETVSRTAHFSGLHRIEMGLWTGAQPQSLVKWVARLKRDAVTLRLVLPKVQIDPLDYATRAHEILEDAQRDFLSGTDVPWSGAGVLGTAAGIAATKELIRTLTPLLEGRDNTYVEVQNWLLQLQQVFDKVRAEHGGNWPSLSQLTPVQREQVNGTMAGTLGALSDVPGTLETAPIPVIPSIPKSG
jgi:high-affinity iron transporter